MSKKVGIELFLSGVLTGSYATRYRHLRQARIIQAAIYHRWKLENPWTWKQKHVIWFLNHYLGKRAEGTQYYYRLTFQLIAIRTGRSWTTI
nr:MULTISPECIES: hypothetical protein [unclassified Pseudomonas]